MNEQDFINGIRHSYVHIEKKITKGNVFNYVKDITEALQNKSSIYISLEILEMTKECFSRYPTQCLPHIKNFVKLSKSNPIFLIFATSILSYLAQNKQNLVIRNYQYYFDDILKEVYPQIQQSRFIIFNNEIPFQFNVNLIFDLLLYSELNQNLIIKFSPYIILICLSGLEIKKKFDNLIDKMINSKLISFLEPKNDLIENISKLFEQKNIFYENIYKQDESVLSILLCTLIFIKKRGRIKINGLDKNTILPFIAISTFFIQETKYFISFAKDNCTSNLLIEGTQLLENNSSHLLIASIETILLNYNSIYYNTIYISQIIQSDTYTQMIEILLNLLINNQYNGNESILFTLILKTFTYCKNKGISNYCIQNKMKIFNYLVSHLENIINCQQIKSKIINNNVFDSTLFLNHIRSLDSLDDLTLFMDFLDKFCYIQSETFSDGLFDFIIEKIKEEKWNEVILIGQFIKKKHFAIEIQKLDELKIPFYVKEYLYGYKPSMDNTVDELIYHILEDPHIEKNDNIFQILFQKMIEDKVILHNYLMYLIAKYNYGNQYIIDTFLKLFLNEYEQFHDDFLFVINKSLYFQKENQILLNRLDFHVSSLPVTYFGYSIINILYKRLEKKASFQAFVCLKNISSSFPFLFEKNPGQIFDFVLPALNHFSLVFEIYATNENLELAKTSVSALFFLVSTLRSPIVLDYFVNWLFSNIENFNDSQILCFIMVLRLFGTDYRVMMIFQIYIKKYNFIEIVSRFLEKNFKDGPFKLTFKENIFGFLEEVYKMKGLLTNQSIIQIEEFSKIDYPFKIFFDDIFSQFSFMNKFDNFNINNISNEMKQFMKDLSKSKDFFIDYDFNLKRTKEPTNEQINNFIKELPTNESLTEPTTANFEGPFTIKMIRYIMKNPIFIHDHLLEKTYYIYLSPEMNELFTKVINDLNEMKNESNDNSNEENSDISSFKREDFFSYLYNLNLFINMINNIKDSSLSDKCFQSIFHIFANMFPNNELFDMILDHILYCFYDIIDNILIFNDPSLMKGIIKLLDFLIQCSDNLIANNNFFNIFGNDLLNITLSLRFRFDSILLQKVSLIMAAFNKNALPPDIIQLISCMLISKNNETIKNAFKLIIKYDPIELQDIFDVFELSFANIMTQEKISDTAIDFFNFYLLKNKDDMNGKIKLLTYCFKQYSVSNQKNTKFFNCICTFFNSIAPKRSMNIFSQINNEIEKVPQYIMSSFPSFWEIFDDNYKMFKEKLKNDPFLLDKLNFLFNYPELVDFKIRSSYFRQKMKAKIDVDETLDIEIDYNNLFDSSFNAFFDQIPEDLLSQIKILSNEITIDMGGTNKRMVHKISKRNFQYKLWFIYMLK